MHKIFSIILLQLYVFGCATTAPELQERAQLAEASREEPVMPVVLPAPTKVVEGFVCRPVAEKVPTDTIEAMGFRIHQLQIIEDGDSAELIIERSSIIGELPLRTLHFPSTRYNIDGHRRYGEWEKSEHWVKLRRTAKGYVGRFVYESEFSLPITCD